MSRSNSSELFILCYDISSNKLRRKIEKKLCDYGFRLQFSVFAIASGTASFLRLKKDLSEILERNPSLQERSDSILYTRLGSANDLYAIAGEAPPGTKDFLVLG